MKKLTSKERAKLRSIAHNIPVIFHVGKNGITDILIKELSSAIKKRELIKIKLEQNVADNVRDLANEISDRMNSEVVQTIGRTMVLYKFNEENKKHVL